MNDINGTLLRHLATGAGAAFFLREKRPELIDLAKKFFDARTDIRRLSTAQDVAKEILSINDLTDLIEIRDVVAKQELRRQIKYGKQQDHTAHTVYLYFLGLWLYDHLPQLSKAIGEKHGSIEAKERDKFFLLQWSYASLLHDIGYAFHNLDIDTQDDRRFIDSIYTWDFVKRQLPEPTTKEAENALLKAHDEWNRKYGNDMRTPTANYASGSYWDVLKRLSEAPWLGDLVDSFRGKDIFSVLDYNGSTLRDYAQEVASNGYGGLGKCVDHAVASGLLLFQYTSFWYWLMKHVDENNDWTIYRNVTGPFNWDSQNLVTDFVDACRAVAFHNIQPSTEIGKIIIPKITINDEPITCLAILCDELQRWDRYPAGDTHLNNYRQYSISALESDDIALICKGTRDEPRAAFIVQTWANTDGGPEMLDDLRTTMLKRFPNYSELLEIGSSF